MSSTNKFFLAVAIIALAAVPLLAIPVRGDTTGTPGQPNQSCQNFFSVNGLQPRGFNTNGFNNTATSVYAGAGANTNTPANSHAVSQYDVACFQASQH
ncbi:MAG TPA: hypothetical protein VFJ63_04310 [Candidatus Bathyarchaeia archaeon]|nr:hypothetical protein [Candidatus Bathyarchaeia archaeon]